MSDSRVVSLDQYRGYCVVGMFVVNFLHLFSNTPHLLKHNNTHFSLADSIMPGFILISGFSFRMTLVKRLQSSTLSEVRGRFVWRSLGLIALSLMFFGFGDNLIASYQELTFANLANFVVLVLKKDMWEVLAIIGGCQILLLPMMTWSTNRRLLSVLGLGVLHFGLTYWFNWNFVNGLPNFLDHWLGTEGKRAWDGGFFGLIAWSQIMLLGTLLPDWVGTLSPRQSAVRLIAVGALLMTLGYSVSCLTRLYDKQPEELAVVSSTDSGSPVLPKLGELRIREWTSMLAEPPFVPPPSKELRHPNYWAMDKRIVSQSFVLFSAGFAISLYAIFIWVCDHATFSLSALNSFGQNPLAAYLIHHLVHVSLKNLFPKDSAAWWAIVGLVSSIAITLTFVRFLEKRNLYLRL